MGKSAPFTLAGKKETERHAKPISRLPTESVRGAERLFPLVGVGASAGGLEALDLFLQNVPAASGMAFVVFQHLEPTQKDFMVELLQRATAMKVAQVKERTVVHPDCVYVIPPNKEMSILHGVLHRLDRIAPHGLHLPIDFFFRSLAEDQRDRSVGVILDAENAPRSEETKGVLSRE